MGTRIFACALIAIFGACRATWAQCPSGWAADEWLSGMKGSSNGLNETLEWDPDGPGPKSPLLVVAGNFSVLGNKSTDNVGAWAGNAWINFGTGLGGNSGSAQVYALASYNGQLVAGGSFQPDGFIQRIAYWNGIQWLPLGVGFDNVVRALVRYNGDLIAGGDFTRTWDGSILANRIARWNGTAWQSMGIGSNNRVRDLIEWGGQLIACGDFTTIGGVFASRIAAWNGSTWQPLSSGMNANVYSLCEFNNELIAGGTFSIAGGSPTQWVARWNGKSWQPFPASPTHAVWSLATWNGKLVAAGGSTNNGVSIWDGVSWSRLPDEIGSGITSFHSISHVGTFGDDLISGGDFNIPGWNIARFNEAENKWERVGRGMNEYVYTTAQHDGDLYLGGRFITGGAVDAARIVRFDGVAHHPLGSGVDNWVFTILPFREDVIVGGYFATAGGIPVNGIARWNKKTGWRDLAGGLGGAQGSLSPSAFALAIYNDDLIVGGNFTTAGGVSANCVARWDGTGWHPVGGGLGGASNSTIVALTVHNGDLIAGGYFTTAGGVPANRIARWDGTQWSALAGGMNDGVLALCTHNGELFAGGGFTQADGNFRNGLARWTGSTWADMNTGSPSIVYALASYDGDLIVGGSLRNHTWSPNLSDRIARWRNGTWSLMGTGVETDIVRTLTKYKNELIAGGQFIKAGGKAAGYWARWRPDCPRGDMDCDQSVNEADIATFVGVLLAPAAATDCQRYLADVTADGEVNGADVSAFVAALKM